MNIARRTGRGEDITDPVNALQYFTNREAAIELFCRFVNEEPLRSYVVKEEYPGEGVSSDADWLAFCRESGETVFHPTSTCRMGVEDSSVVDPRLRMRGLAGLRVIDASVMPSVVSGNTNAATIAIAEKGADLVLEDEKR